MAFSTTTELAQYTEKELGHQLSGSSSQRTDIVSHLDRAHKIVCAGGGFLNYDESGRRMRDDTVFSFARAQNPYVLTLIPEISTANVTATRNSTSVSFGADPNSGTSVAGYFLRVQNEQELYRIASHTAASTSAVLDGAYVGPANVSAANCEILKLHYSLGSSDILRLVSPIRAFGDYDKINLVDKAELTDQYPLQDTQIEFPSCAALIKEDAGTLTLQFSSVPLDYERIEIDYVPIPTTLDTTSSNPIIPAQFRLVLAHLAIYFMSIRNDDARAEKHLSIAQKMFRELVDWDEKLKASADSDYGRIMVKSSASSSRRLDVQKEYE